MDKDAHVTSRRWIGLLLAGAFALAACGSGTESPTDLANDSGDSGVADVEGSELALADEAPEIDPADDDAVDEPPMELDLDEFDSLDDLDGVTMTPELFEALRTSEVMRPLVIQEMADQGLSPEEAGCFFDNVSPELFVVFGEGEAPNDEQFAELMDLLVICEIPFTAGG